MRCILGFLLPLVQLTVCDTSRTLYRQLIIVGDMFWKSSRVRHQGPAGEHRLHPGDDRTRRTHLRGCLDGHHHVLGAGGHTSRVHEQGDDHGRHRTRRQTFTQLSRQLVGQVHGRAHDPREYCTHHLSDGNIEYSHVYSEYKYAPVFKYIHMIF